MEFISEKIIKLDRELSDLDKFALDFIKIIKKYSDYVIVSGYVSILLGRSRASEDIDILVEKIDRKKFKLFLKELNKNNFYCLNSKDPEDIYDYLKNKLAVRFAKNDTVIPNMELKFLKTYFDRVTIDNKIKVSINNQEINISKLEVQVAFKEKVLKSPKDIEDARHIRNISNLDEELINKYKEMLNEI